MSEAAIIQSGCNTLPGRIYFEVSIALENKLLVK
jgi:hypothetical protein